MTGDGRRRAARTTGSSPRHRFLHGELIGIGVGRGRPETLAPAAVDTLAAADCVFVSTAGADSAGTDSAGPGRAGPDFAGPDFANAEPPTTESTLLYYAEAWRLEPLPELSGAVGLLARWFAANPGGRAVLAVPGDPASFPAFLAVVDGLRVVAPGVRTSCVPGVSIVPPRLSPLTW